MNITIIGGGNIGTLMAAEFANCGHRVNIFTSSPERWSKNIKAIDRQNELVCEGTLFSVTNDLQLAIQDSDYILVTLPSIAQKAFAEQLLPFAGAKMKIGIIPGYGGAEIIFKPLADKGAVIFGFQRVHAIARLVEYGKTVCMNSRKDAIFLAALDPAYTDKLCRDMQALFKMPCNALPSYLCVTLTPSNPILHTSRLYSMFSEYKEGLCWPRNILFYEEWTDLASSVLIESDKELQSICKELDKMDLSSVRSLKDHYESYSVKAMTEKISSISAFKGITSPMKKSNDGWIPDFDSRYFSCDFAYGLEMLRQFGEILSVDTPTIDIMMEWYKKASGNTAPTISLRSAGINDKQDIYNYYGLST